MIQSYISKTLFGTTSVRYGFETKDVEGSKETVMTDNGISMMFFYTIRYDTKRKTLPYLLKRKKMKDQGRLQEEGK